MRSFPPILAAAVLLGACLAPVAGRAQPAAAPPPSLILPLACQVGRTCEIQHYVDRDPGPGVRDYRCGHRTNDRHDGIDFRLLDEAQRRAGVNVVAAAAGRVVAVRDGVQDISIRAPGAPSVAGHECGNRVAVGLGAGWLINYCHLAQGSLKVKVGDVVAAGQPLGQVGLSGDTEFPHLHFSLRHGAEVVDPFAPDPAAAARCDLPAGTGLWSAETARSLGYKAGVVINAGFSGGEVTPAAVESRTAAPASPDAPALIAYVRLIGLEAGDLVKLSLAGPDGRALATVASPPLDRDKAEWLSRAGVRRPAAGWAHGSYVATVEVVRAGAVAIRQSWRMGL